MKGTIPFTVGVEIDNGGFLPLIVRNSTLPVRVTRFFTTLAAVQPAVEIHVLKGEHGNASRNSTLGRFLMPNEIRETPLLNPRIEVTLEAGLDSLVHLSARILPSGRIFRTTVSTNGKADLAGDGGTGMAGNGQRIRMEALFRKLETMAREIPPEEPDFKIEVREILLYARKAILSASARDVAASQVMLESAIGEILAIREAGADEGQNRE
jgi:molecular chaperone DnaK (HSP70)